MEREDATRPRAERRRGGLNFGRGLGSGLRGLASGRFAAEAGDQAGERDLGEGGDAEVGVGEIVVGGGGAGADDGGEVGAFRGEAAGVRILEGDGFMAAEAKAVEDKFVEVGLGFGRGGVFAAGEEGEAVEEAEAGEVAFAVVVAGIGGEAEGKRDGARGVEEGEDAGEHGEGEVVRAIACAALGFEGDAVGALLEGVPGVEGVVGVANGAEEFGFVEGDAVRGVDIGVGADEGGLGG